MKTIAVIGEILVEVMADTAGTGFTQPQPLTGPYPSGAPAIFADQAARLGQPVGIISAVGDDDFGRLNLARLSGDGVDISGVYIDKDRPTGSAFVRYRTDGSRDFIFNIKHSACGSLQLTPDGASFLESADHLHVMGSSLSGPDFVSLNMSAIESVKARGGTVSFDPNLRKEMLSLPGMADAMKRIVAVTDLFLPSGDELMLLTEANDPKEAVSELLEHGIQAIVHKNGADGAHYYHAGEDMFVAPFPVDEIDPTGAGDCFGGAFVALWLRGASIREALTFAAAAGARAVMARGPMEGVSDYNTLQQFIRSHTGASV